MEKSERSPVLAPNTLTEGECAIVREIDKLSYYIGNAWLFSVAGGIVLMLPTMLVLAYTPVAERVLLVDRVLTPNGVYVLFSEMGIVFIVWSAVLYLSYFRASRQRKIAELEAIAADPATATAVEKLKHVARAIQELAEFGSVCERL